MSGTGENPDLQMIERACQQLAERCGELSWEWDGRFDAALAVVRAPADADMLTRVGEVLPSVWDPDNVAQASQMVRAIAQVWGLRQGQRMFVLDPDHEPLLYAAWWPWNGGKSFSLRVSCTADEALPVVRRCFGL